VAASVPVVEAQCWNFLRLLHALQGGAVPVSEMFGTFALSVGAAVRGAALLGSSSSNLFFPLS
jgi:hypothetical protein